MTMRLYDTLTQDVVPFAPEHVDAAHLGHIATYLAYDVLQRRLRDLGHETRCVRNVTDVDDDLLRKARSLGVHYLDLAAEQTAYFDEQMASLGMLASFSEPRATSAISDILRFIGQLFDGGHAYQSGGAVYFDVTSYAGFGALGHYDRAMMLELAAERGGNPGDPNKRDPLDFVLWQPSLSDEPAWESLWGPGRPGWHIECSALARRELGNSIDVHGGGFDLVFPHHECERAQSESANGTRFVRLWLHVGMVKLNGEKMSKSLGNLVFAGELLKEHDASAIRLALLSQHYRSSYEWNDQMLSEAEERLALWRGGGAGDAGIDAARDRLDDDLDTAGVLEALDEQARAGRGVATAASLLGVVV